MRKKINIFLAVALMIVLSSCGFKPVAKSKFQDFNIVELNTNNNKKINFILRQKMKRALSNKEATNQIVLTINTSQIRNVNEKNVKNQITKYEISLTAKVDIIFLDKNKNKIFEVNDKGVYDIGSTHSDTMKNKKNVEELLAKRISEKIINKIIFSKDDL